MVWLEEHHLLQLVRLSQTQRLRRDDEVGSK
jgi:hypothetical protein